MQSALIATYSLRFKLLTLSTPAEGLQLMLARLQVKQ